MSQHTLVLSDSDSCSAVMQVPVSTVTDSERLLFRKLHYPGIYRCVARYGYHDQVHMGSKFVIKLLDKVMP